MTRQEIEQKVNQVFHEGFEVPYASLTPSALLFQDLGFDSLDAVDLLVYLEERLGVRVETEAFANVRTLENVYSTVEDLIQKKQIKLTREVPELQKSP